MRIPRLSRPWRRRMRPQLPDDTVTASQSQFGSKVGEEDARLLRRTRLRLMGVSGIVTLLILGGLGLAVYTATSSTFTNDSVGRLQGYADLNVDLISNLVVGPSQPASPHDLNPEFGTRFSGIFVIGMDSSSDVLLRTRYMPPWMPVAAGLAAVSHGGVDVREVTSTDGVPLRVYTESVKLVNGDVYVVQTATDRTQEVNLLGLLRTVLLGGGLIALALALLAGYLYAGRALVPIRQSIDRRQAALQRQREFAANASHELRTPLTVIGASVEDLKRNRRSRVEDVGEAVGDIEAEVRHMTALVEDMLLLARTDSGVVLVDMVPVDLGDIAADATSMLTTLGQERGVNVVLDPLPAPLTGDPMRLRQLVTILVDNALRHSPAGSTVEARVRPDGAAALLQVDDQGPGIKPEDLPRLFERFWRADNAPAGGTGLGLAIAKWIVEQHGGVMDAINRPEGGASFRVWLPNRPIAAPAADETTRPAGIGNLMPVYPDPGIEHAEAADSAPNPADWSAPPAEPKGPAAASS